MSLEIQTNTLQQRRQTFAHIARRFGEDRPATRYEEATLDLQPQRGFHYRPTWDPAHTLYDKSRTAITMADWYQLTDPRQFYYGTYTISRARMIETVDRNFERVARRGLFDAIDPDWQDLVRFYLIPLRHVEWGANMNACNITDVGCGTTVTQPAIFAAMDRLGMAQIISRLGLALGGAETLALGKDIWMTAPEWQPMRRLVEDSLVIEDWFEQLVMQFFTLDGLLFPLVYEAFDERGMAHGASGLSLICEFMVDWQRESSRWIDAVLTRAARETTENAALIGRWHTHWQTRALEALAPLAGKVLGDEGEGVLAALAGSLAGRAAKIGMPGEGAVA